ncbi:MAG TPA: response regulator transcription factor [bacterium]|nr:response regulator transcription factor [bacterium]
MGIRVLLVDNHELFRHGIKAALQTQSAIEIIGEAASANEAIDKAAALKPDLVMLEIMVPGGDGVAAIRTIRQHCPHAGILVLTYATDPDNFHEALQAGVIAYLLKDIDPATLIRAIFNAHAGRTTLSPSAIEYIIDHYFRAFNKTERRWEDTASDREPPLTDREIEVLAGVGQGLSNRQIAARLFLSESTVKTRLRAVYRKFRLRNRAHAAVFARDNRLVDHERPGYARIGFHRAPVAAGQRSV